MSLDAWQTWSASGNIADLSHGAARLLPLIDHNLRHHGGEGVVGSGTELLAAMWCETQLLHHEAGEMLRALERGRVDTLLLKGAALTFLDYPEPSLRPMADVDVLVRPGDIRRAIDILRRSGWKPTHDSPEALFPFQHATSFTNERGSSVDLHARVRGRERSSMMMTGGSGSAPCHS